MIKLYVAKLSLLMNNPELYATCYELSTTERKRKADSRKCAPDKVRCIGAGLLLQYAYGQFVRGKAAADSEKVAKTVTVPVEKLVSELAADREMHFQMPPEKEGTNGKPYLESPGDTGEVYFNLSHSDHMAACIIADKEVGLDIQKKCKVRESVVRKCFLPEEAALLQAEEAISREDGADRIFTRIWSRKEALAKLTGRGLSQILEEASQRKIAQIFVESHWIDDAYALSYAFYEE